MSTNWLRVSKFWSMVKIVLGTEYMSTNLLKSKIWLILIPESNKIVLSTWVHEYKLANRLQILGHGQDCGGYRVHEKEYLEIQDQAHSNPKE